MSPNPTKAPPTNPASPGGKKFEGTVTLAGDKSIDKTIKFANVPETVMVQMESAMVAVLTQLNNNPPPPQQEIKPRIKTLTLTCTIIESSDNSGKPHGKGGKPFFGPMAIPWHDVPASGAAYIGNLVGQAFAQFQAYIVPVFLVFLALLLFAPTAPAQGFCPTCPQQAPVLIQPQLQPPLIFQPPTPAPVLIQPPTPTPIFLQYQPPTPPPFLYQPPTPAPLLLQGGGFSGIQLQGGGCFGGGLLQIPSSTTINVRNGGRDRGVSVRVFPFVDVQVGQFERGGRSGIFGILGGGGRRGGRSSCNSCGR